MRSAGNGCTADEERGYRGHENNEDLSPGRAGQGATRQPRRGSWQGRMAACTKAAGMPEAEGEGTLCIIETTRTTPPKQPTHTLYLIRTVL